MSIAKISATPREVVFTPDRSRRAAEAARGKNRAKGKGHPTTSEPNYTVEELEFMKAIEAFKNRSGRKFPTWSEVLRVVRLLGYVKEPSEEEFDRP